MVEWLAQILTVASGIAVILDSLQAFRGGHASVAHARGASDGHTNPGLGRATRDDAAEVATDHPQSGVREAVHIAQHHTCRDNGIRQIIVVHGDAYFGG
ncbi:hypothetical protein [Streptomyces cavourensis]|uniref:Uncharacterized protein n=1 Tax=Streptomyces cavourensis TaxID=67258 RepID=A0ABY5FJN4_9ACTN|nr:hypothetical protein [Streptomyces cavourensis]UTR83664.1 hypothetical protein NLU04_34710 [Streptomyces cavourensis]